MRLTRAYRLWISWLLGCTLVTGCAGGSGSSGFDISPSTENAAIELAIDERRCVDFEGLLLCPAETAGRPDSTATPTGTPSMTPTPTPPSGTVPSPTPDTPAQPSATPTPGVVAEPAVELDFGQEGVARCSAAEPGPGCAVAVPFTPQGFDTISVFRVAIRTLDPETFAAPAAWRIGEEAAPTGGVDAASFEAVVFALPGDVAVDDAVLVQLAVLVFPGPPEFVPATVELLSESGAEYAFVTSPLRLEGY